MKGLEVASSFLDKVNNHLSQMQAEPEPRKMIPGREFGTRRERREYLTAAVTTRKRVLFREMPA